jgi:hypothetical protein
MCSEAAAMQNIAASALSVVLHYPQCVAWLLGYTCWRASHRVSLPPRGKGRGKAM